MERYRFVSEAGAYYVTFSIVDWLPVFVSEAACRIVTDSLNFCHEHKGLRTNAFVIMPTHMHAIVFDANWNADALQRALTDFRKFTGRQLLDYSAKHMPACFSRVFESQAGGDRERRFWQSSRHPEAIQSEPFWRQKLDYLHENPCRKGLVIRGVDWRFSSARWYASDGQEKTDVLLSKLQF